MFQDANVKLIRELREEIGRLKAMLLSFELVCGHQSCLSVRPFFCRGSEPCCILYSHNQVMLEEQSGGAETGQEL